MLADSIFCRFKVGSAKHNKSATLVEVAIFELLDAGAIPASSIRLALRCRSDSLMVYAPRKASGLQPLSSGEANVSSEVCHRHTESRGTIQIKKCHTTFTLPVVRIILCILAQATTQVEELSNTTLELVRNGFANTEKVRLFILKSIRPTLKLTAASFK